MGIPGPKPAPSNVHHLYPPSHRPQDSGLQLPVERPDEPDWALIFPTPAKRAAAAKLASTRERRAMMPSDVLDAINQRARHVAHTTWALVVEDLYQRGVIAKVDQIALRDLCITIARLDQAEREISAKGALLEGERGLVKNPALTFARQYREQLNRLLPEFGLTPSARTRLKAQGFGTDDGDGLFD